LALISTAHDAVNFDELGRWANIIVDTRNAMASVAESNAKVYAA